MKKNMKTGNKWHLFVAMIFLFISFTMNAQNAPITTAATITNAVPGQHLMVPVTVTGFIDITSITLNLDYEYTKLQIDTGATIKFLPGKTTIGDFNLGGGIHRLTISWLGNGNSISEPDGFSLVNLAFTYISGTGDLIWYDDGESCSYTGPPPIGKILNDTPTSIYYINGEVSGTKVLNIKVFLEGPYSAGAMSTTLNPAIIPHAQPYNVAPWNYAGTESVTSIPADVVDWVLVDLRDAATPAEATTSLTGWPKAYFLKSDGQIVALDGISLPDIGNPTVSNNLYVVVRHRNHIAVMSATGIALTGNSYVYDFTTAVTQAFGGAAGYKQIATGIYGMVAGDADGDGNVYPTDYNQWASKYNSTGYKNSDFDMDGNVYPTDYNKWASNYNKGNPLTKNLDNVLFRSQVPCDFNK